MIEQWEKIEVNDKFYYVSNFGNVKSELGKPIKCRLDKKGYLIFTCGKKSKRRTVYVHRLVAMLFVDGYKDGYDVNHKDYNRKNPRADNLEWITHKENVLYSLENRADVNGINNPNAKLTVEEVIQIRSLACDGNSISSISRTYCIGRTAISRIINNETWKNI